jgi:acetolactate synthase-1/2/3 large subunit
MNDMKAPLAGKVSGGDIIVKALKNKGIERIYSLCGGFLNPILIACQKQGIEVVTTRNEMEAGFMANAAARTTRKVSVCLAEPSGFTNYISAVADAHFAGDPVIFIGVSSNMKNFNNNGLKELPQPDVVKSMTKYAVEINDPTRIEWFLDKAFDIANNYPKGPVQLSIPTNFVFTGKVESPPNEDARTFDKFRKKTHRPHPDPEDIEQIEELLAQSVKPVIISGGGVWYSEADKMLENFAADNNIPIFTPFTHLKSVDMAHPMYMGLYDYHQNPCSRVASAEADLILYLGGRLDFGLNYGEAPLIGKNAKLVCVNPTARELSENALADVRICSDIRALLECLASRSNISPNTSDWADRIKQARLESLEPYRQFLISDTTPVHPLRLCYDVLMSLDEEDILVIDGGDISCWCETAFNFWAFEGRKIGGVIANGPWEQMGTGPAYGTAVKMSNPNSRVVVITGDGALGLSPGLTPLETAIDREIPITVVVSNNAKWGMIYEQQSAMWGETYATSLRDVNYSEIFEASGAHAQVVTEAVNIKDALNNASGKNRLLPSFIEVKTLSTPSPITQGLVEMRVRTAIE